jgi:hypothetical protein
MITFLGVVFAAIAAWAAWRTASETNRMVQARVILQIRQQFFAFWEHFAKQHIKN